MAPFGLFCTGTPRLLAALLVLGLQVGIQLGGNFGHFNVLSAVLCNHHYSLPACVCASACLCLSVIRCLSLSLSMMSGQSSSPVMRDACEDLGHTY
eukprot:COSAG05_NODE_3836_length_1812_cov_2.752481_2_plen_95_part_01